MFLNIFDIFDLSGIMKYVNINKYIIWYFRLFDIFDYLIFSNMFNSKFLIVATMLGLGLGIMFAD